MFVQTTPRQCRKCGAYQMIGPVYRASEDRLVYRCGCCGYKETELPKDHKEKHSLKDIAEKYFQY